VTDELAEVVERLTGAPPRSIGFADGNPLVVTADGQRAVLKSGADQPGQVRAEVAGLRWLASASTGTSTEGDTVPVPTVLGHDEDWLLLEYLPPSRPDRAAAEVFGERLARLHAAGAPAFGAPPPDGPEQAWIGRAPMGNITGADWPSWYAEHRVLPYARIARDTGRLDPASVQEIEAAATALSEVPELAGPPPVAPARLHGDLWSGNVCWTASGGDGASAWLIDPAAHGGHPETDLAMLALFGCPHLDSVLTGYQQVSPLAEGWTGRIGLHQLFPLLVHVLLFGHSYAGPAVAAARSVRRLARGIP
jgi:fructosamine-3-kinase